MTTVILVFFQMPVQIQDSLIVMCKKKARETHRVKTEKIKIQTAKRLDKKNALKDQQLVQKLAKFKDASLLHQQFTSPHPWSKDGDDYTALQLIDFFLKVCLPLTKTKNVPKEAPMEHPRLPLAYL